MTTSSKAILGFMVTSLAALSSGCTKEGLTSGHTDAGAPPPGADAAVADLAPDAPLGFDCLFQATMPSWAAMLPRMPFPQPMQLRTPSPQPMQPRTPSPSATRPRTPGPPSTQPARANHRSTQGTTNPWLTLAMPQRTLLRPVFGRMPLSPSVGRFPTAAIPAHA
jgi:hypothetical protein